MGGRDVKLSSALAMAAANLYPPPAFRHASMMIKELRPESKVDVIDLTIKSKSEVRDFTSRSGSAGRVCDANATDGDDDECQLTLWNDEIERVQVNDRVRITNGWVRQWRGNLQVSAGRYGRLEVLK